MKARFILTFIFFILLQSLFAQVTPNTGGQNPEPTDGSYSPRSDCQSYNRFLSVGENHPIYNFSEKVYPKGKIILDYSKADEYGGAEGIAQLLSDGNETTFELVSQTQSRINPDKVYLKYQQYYNGIKVDGGGYTAAGLIVGGTTTNPCGDNGIAVYMISPQISNDIRSDVRVDIAKEKLDNILPHQGKIHAELVISQNLLNNCQYHFVWKANYSNNGGKTSWIDAKTGSILRTIDSEMNINAPTATYGLQFLNDTNNGGTTTLISPNGRLNVYDFGNSFPSGLVNHSQWNTNLIPTTTGGTWTTEADSSVYQAFHAMEEVLPIFDDLGINFGVVNVGVGNVYGAASLRRTTIDSTNIEIDTVYIRFGLINGRPTSLYDITAHELGHAFIRPFLDYTNSGNRSLHEGIADMFGVYGESIIQDSIDWIVADDESAVEADHNRHLDNPQFDCFTQVVSLNAHHTRSLPLGHWFHLISAGDQSTGIPALGVERALLIVIESLNLMGVDDDYEDMREAVIAFVDEEFDACSDERKAVYRAWSQICVGPNLPNFGCDFFLLLPHNVCEEDNYLHFCIEEGVVDAIPDIDMKWTIIASNSPQFVMEGNQTGNSVYGGQCLTITQFPTYPYYPRYITIKVSSPIIGGEYTYTTRFVLMDCDGDDPTCYEFYNNPSPLQGNGSHTDERSDNQLLSQSNPEFLQVLDITGRLIYKGAFSAFDVQQIDYSGLVIMSYFDKNRKLIKSEKRIVFE